MDVRSRARTTYQKLRCDETEGLIRNILVSLDAITLVASGVSALEDVSGTEVGGSSDVGTTTKGSTSSAMALLAGDWRLEVSRATRRSKIRHKHMDSAAEILENTLTHDAVDDVPSHRENC